MTDDQPTPSATPSAGEPDVDLDFTHLAAPAAGPLPDAVDADGHPIALEDLNAATGPTATGTTEAELGLPSTPAVDPAGAGVDAVALAGLPHEDWTRVDERGSSLSPQHKTLAKGVIAALALLLVLPLLVTLLLTLNGLS